MMTPGLVPYSATKGAVKMFTQGLSREVGTRGITVNNVQPGPIDTDLNPRQAIGPRRRRPPQRSTATDLLTKSPRWSRSWLVRRRRTSPART
jgi:NAD(P)-dependent dehydrogenase (short-subunit alcohol dehydrogenase family)